MAMVLPSNEYAALGIVGAVDCDGPLAVMLLAIPSYCVYGGGLIAQLFVYFNTKKEVYLSIFLFCFIIIAALTPNVIDAINEHSKNESEYFITCGKGW